MTQLNPTKTACLTLDFQSGILQMVPGSDAVVGTASKMAAFARAKGYLLIHVGLGFEKGYPEFPAHSPMGQRLKEQGLFLKGTPTAEFHKDIAKAGDLIVYKHRVSGFTENQLHMILRSRGIENLVMFGIATSGIVLSTLRRAFDLDYQSVVIEDACYDPDQEVHRVLTEKVFSRQARVVKADAFIGEQ